VLSNEREELTAVRGRGAAAASSAAGCRGDREAEDESSPAAMLSEVAAKRQAALDARRPRRAGRASAGLQEYDFLVAAARDRFERSSRSG
jgi:hypothetical protein